MKTDYEFTLYVTGETMGSQRAKTALTTIFDSVLKDRYRLEVIDIRNHPEKADEAGIVIIPTLIRIYPEPEKRFIGDFTSESKLLSAITI